ncbi:DUF4190 domain-containing protein [Rhodococcus sp. 14C212]|uniref:DUF4190 domain-containing protein n=1 Tax=Rhodococcus sp. 14C212 TaxID=2711209 RepID=UPI0013EC8142|nr:DUF4190 domain-containing protein [Rhodococcus sp. 14C212]NGP04841.1 DUF4190 domain-containing protein [Rhodococcus sp. 14C212]
MIEREPAGASAAGRDPVPGRDPLPGRDPVPGRDRVVADDRVTDRTTTAAPFEERVTTKPAKTSVAAALALAVGTAALVCVLSLVLSPVGLVLSLLGLVLGIVGLRAARRLGVTGRGVAIAGIVLSIVSLVLSIAYVAGVVTVLNNDRMVEQLEQQLDRARDQLPDSIQVPQPSE